MCSSCGYEQEVYEEEAKPEAEVDFDRLQQALKAAWLFIQHNAGSQIVERKP